VTVTEATATFDNAFESVSAARRFVERAVREWGDEGLAEEAALVVTELATNALIHARSRFAVSVRRADDVVRIAVTDASVRVPVARSRSAQATTGRGMRLVTAFADAWGVERHLDGKTVWCTLRRAPGRPVGATPPSAPLARRTAARATRVLPAVHTADRRSDPRDLREVRPSERAA
jgi:anti-sigma regulatory factor (Ser/Thr protein kinase)